VNERGTNRQKEKEEQTERKMIIERVKVGSRGRERETNRSTERKIKRERKRERGREEIREMERGCNVFTFEQKTELPRMFRRALLKPEIKM
jgi:hypothetical protein